MEEVAIYGLDGTTNDMYACLTRGGSQMDRSGVSKILRMAWSGCDAGVSLLSQEDDLNEHEHKGEVRVSTRGETRGVP